MLDNSVSILNLFCSLQNVLNSMFTNNFRDDKIKVVRLHANSYFLWESFWILKLTKRLHLRVTAAAREASRA